MNPPPDYQHSDEFLKWIFQAHVRRFNSLAHDRLIELRGNPLAGLFMDLSSELSESVLRVARSIFEEISRKAGVLRGIGVDLRTADKLIGEDIMKEDIMRAGRHTRPAGPPLGANREGSRPLPKDPRELNRLWSELSETDRDTLHWDDPFIGNHDGIPNIDRDHYNQRTLKMLQEEASADYITAHNEADIARRDAGSAKQATRQKAMSRSARAEAKAEAKRTRDAAIEATAREKTAQRKVENYGRIARAIEPKAGAPDTLLLHVDDKFRTVAAGGNPDEAKNIVTYIPGTGKNPIASMASCDSLREAALRADPDSSTVAIRWEPINRPADASFAWDPTYAAESAETLRRFQEGLHVTHEGSPAHMSVVSQSYGCVIAGHGAMEPLRADALAFMGSFGVGVDNVKQLHLVGVASDDIKDHVFATRAAHDPFKLFPRNHGPSPTSSEFGATNFTSDSQPGHWKSFKLNPENHIGYMRGQTMDSIGLIITGQENKVT